MKNLKSLALSALPALPALPALLAGFIFPAAILAEGRLEPTLKYEPGTPAVDMASEKKTSVSPITYASSDDPPILIIHGDADTVVPVEHAERLHAALEKAGGETELFIVEGGEHNVAGGAGREATARATEFFRKHLLSPGKAAAE